MKFAVTPLNGADPICPFPNEDEDEDRRIQVRTGEEERGGPGPELKFAVTPLVLTPNVPFRDALSSTCADGGSDGGSDRRRGTITITILYVYIYNIYISGLAAP